MSLKEYKPGTTFNGVIGRTFDVSEPAWPEPIRAKEGAPNVLFIAIDDMNDWIGCHGTTPAAITPNIDRLAERGVNFTNAHTAGVFCAPSRAAIAARKPAPPPPMTSIVCGRRRKLSNEEESRIRS